MLIVEVVVVVFIAVSLGSSAIGGNGCPLALILEEVDDDSSDDEELTAVCEADEEEEEEEGPRKPIFQPLLPLF